MIVVELTGLDLTTFLTACHHFADNDCTSLQIGYDDVDGGVKAKFNSGVWSPPLGTVVS